MNRPGGLVSLAYELLSLPSACRQTHFPRPCDSRRTTKKSFNATGRHHMNRRCCLPPQPLLNHYHQATRTHHNTHFHDNPTTITTPTARRNSSIKRKFAFLLPRYISVSIPLFTIHFVASLPSDSPQPRQR